MRPPSVPADRHDCPLLRLVFVLALALGAVFALAMPYDSSDWVLYRNVAGNILSGCGVAMTIPGVGACKPHFGALVWLLTGHSNVAILMVQSMLSAAATAYLAQAVHAVRADGGADRGRAARPSASSAPAISKSNC